MEKPFILSFASLLFIIAISTSQVHAQPSNPIPYLSQEYAQVEPVLESMSTEEKIAQLIMIPVYSNRDKKYEDSIVSLVEKHQVGGLIFFQGGPVRQANLTNRLQVVSKIPSMVAIDAEWGLGMRLDSTISYPYQMALGGIEDEHLIYEMGQEIARQCKRMGIHINFAPAVDINTNPNNPVIGFRSFGDDKKRVAALGAAYMRGMQDAGVLASAKHFPGHGDTHVDSHFGLPRLDFSKKRLDEIELYPFRELIRQGLGSVMVAHMSIPVIDSTPDLASTLSRPVVTDLLKKEMNYHGLVFTDALNMQAVAEYYPPGVVDAKALLAGNDVMLNTMDVEATIREVKAAIDRGEITIEEIEDRVRKVLKAKQWMGLDQWTPVSTRNLVEDLNNGPAKYLHRRLVESSVTLLRNSDEIIPIRNLKEEKLAYLALGAEEKTPFQKALSRYVNADLFYLSKESDLQDIETLTEQLRSYTKVIVGIHGISLGASVKNFGITAEMKFFLKNLIREVPAIVSVFGNVYSLDEFDNIGDAPGLLMTYQAGDLTQDIAAQIIFGAQDARGKLPVTVSDAFQAGDGLNSQGGLRLAYSIPESQGLSSEKLSRIDTLVELAIREEAIPGAQLLVAKNGSVIYQKSFGYHTYDNQIPVRNTDLYDLASITKISTALAAFMKLKGEGKFDESKTLGSYLPMARGTNKENLIYSDILTHQAGLKSFIAFWQDTKRKNGSFRWFTFKHKQNRRFPIKVADQLYIHRNYERKIYKKIMKSPVDPDQGYVYSDLSFVLAPKVVENITNTDFDAYLYENLYAPLGAGSLTFNPYLNYASDEIVPTEYDADFREQLVAGTVHDEGAAMLGGVSGHAGLFGNANDLAKLMQLYLNDGKYGGEVLIPGNVVSEYSRCVHCPDNYRAMGFDRPSRPGDPNGNTAVSAPLTTFGHTGFTGTCTWIDPENQIVYIFLSNRVNPTRDNPKFFRLNTRTEVMEAIYQAMNP